MINKMTNVFGGEMIYQNGQFVGSSVPNIFGGLTFHDVSGSVVGQTAENVFGGVDMRDASGVFQGHTSENITGGSNIYDGSGSFSGFTSEFGDMGTLFNANGGIENIVSSGGVEVFGSLDLDADSLMETMSTIGDII